MVFDKFGNLFITDRGNSSIRKVTPGGLITTIAGTGETGFSGDGGPASRAQLSPLVYGIAVDSKGDIYLSGTGNNRIRKISASDGRIRTFFNGATLSLAATAFALRGIACDGADNLYLAVAGKRQILQLAPDGTSSVFAGTGFSAEQSPPSPGHPRAPVA
jgi:sugar lactone lactonase YvrE